MTNPVASDKLSTHLSVKERKVDVQTSNRPTADATEESATPTRGDSADVRVATERLAQQLNNALDSGIDSAQQARERIAQLQIDISRDPSAVLGAFGSVSQNTFEAAIARPSD